VTERISADDLAIGIDIGGSKTAIGVVRRSDGLVLDRRTIATPLRDRSGPTFLAALARHAEDLRQGKGIVGTVDRVGIGVCELVESSGEIVSSHRIAMSQQGVREAFRGFSEICIDSDVRVAAIAEARYGHGAKTGCWLYVNAGTGISSVLMHGEMCHVGAHGWVYSLGMSPADLTTPIDGKALTIEEISGGAGLLRLARQRGLDVEEVRNLFELAASQSEPATDILSLGGRVLGGAIALLTNTLDPAAIVVGGGIVSFDSAYWRELVAALRTHVWHPAAKQIDVRPAALSVDAGMIGAAVIRTAARPI
jgi:glucokinase